MADGAAKGRSSKEERTGDRNILFLHLYLFQSVRNFCFPTLCQWFPPRGNFSITEHHTMLQNVSSFLLVPAILEILLHPISSNCHPLSSRPFQFQVPAPISLRVSQKIPRSGSTKRVFSCVVCLTSNLPLMSPHLLLQGQSICANFCKYFCCTLLCISIVKLCIKQSGFES